MIRKIEHMLIPKAIVANAINPLFRVMTSLIFIVGGLGHFGKHQVMLDRMATSPWQDVVNTIGDPSILLWMSGGVFVIFGIMLALGFMTRLSALLLLFTRIPLTIAIHVAPGHIGPLFKNMAILGALLHFYANGAGAYSLDSRNSE